jgi:predicted short-subunit dehydrogenase-like oxidoreductase (DUF2520 family)
MISIVIIGSGNVAQHLIKTFTNNPLVDVIQCFARNKKTISHLVDIDKIVDNFLLLKPADIYIIAVTDTAIVEVSNQIPFKDKLVVHTSGSVAMNELSDNNRKGVFYPLQTFSKTKVVNFSEVPICIESQNESNFKVLEKMANSISNSVYSITSEQRKSLHVAAVFVSNFVNHLYTIGNQICDENNVSFDVLKPLIQETAQKIKTLSPQEAQTGPAKRNDTTTINKHLLMLTNDNQKEIYKLLTKSIIDNGKKL